MICQCPEGFKLSDKPNAVKCVDVREDSCFDEYRYGRCSISRMGTLTKKQCCCTMGKAWSRSCEKCPSEGTGQYAMSSFEDSNPNLNHSHDQSLIVKCRKCRNMKKSLHTISRKPRFSLFQRSSKSCAPRAPVATTLELT